MRFSDAAECDDGNPCTESDVCTRESVPVLRSAAASAATTTECWSRTCYEAVCNQTTGICEVAYKENAACDHENPCVSQATCNAAGLCVGTPDAGCVRCDNNQGGCSAVTVNQCQEAICNQTTGICEVRNKTTGTACNDGNPCTENDKCTAAGVCEGSITTAGCVRCDNNGGDCTTFPVTDEQCQKAVCDTDAGFCVVEDAEDGVECDAGNPCTTGDACSAGACTPGPVTPGCGGVAITASARKRVWMNAARAPLNAARVPVETPNSRGFNYCYEFDHKRYCADVGTFCSNDADGNNHCCGGVCEDCECQAFDCREAGDPVCNFDQECCDSAVCIECCVQ